MAAMGHEALAAVGLLMREGDLFAGYYRDRPIALGRGVEVEELVNRNGAVSQAGLGGAGIARHLRTEPSKIDQRK